MIIIGKKEKNTNVNAPKKDRIYLVNSEFKLKNTETKKDTDSSKIYIYDLIKYFGLNFQELSDSSRYPLDLSNCQYTNEGKTKKETLTYLYENSRGIKKLLFNNKTGAFSIGEIGRYKINKKFSHQSALIY